MENFDIFISYKNLDVRGEQTWESQIASELHEFLSSRGLKTFCSNISLAQLGMAEYKRAIDYALDGASVLIAVGSSFENLDSEWVRYEWDSFFNDILSRRKPEGRIFTYLNNLTIKELPRTLRNNQVINHSPDGFERLYNFVKNALAIQSVSNLASAGKKAMVKINEMIRVMAESRLLELEITSGMFGAMFTQEQQQRMKKQIETLRTLTQSDEKIDQNPPNLTLYQTCRLTPTRC